MKPRELAKKLNVQLWTPVYTRGKGVGMKKDDDAGTYIDLGELSRVVPQPSSNEERLREALEAALGCCQEVAHEVADPLAACAEIEQAIRPALRGETP